MLKKEALSKSKSKEINLLVELYQSEKISKDVLDYFLEYNKITLTDQQYEQFLSDTGINSLNIESETYFEEPLISVIIPTYNRNEMLIRAIESVLSQNYSNVEIIIVDDCSLDQSEEIIKKKYYTNNKIQYYKNEKKMNAGYNRNFAYKKAKGEFVIFLDDDDFYIDKNFFKKSIEKLNKNKNLAFVSGNAFIQDQNHKKLTINQLNVSDEIDGAEYLLHFQTRYMKPFSTFTSVFNKSKLDELDFENMKMMNDSAIYLKSLLLGDAYIMDDIIGVYVVHNQNISSNLSADFLIDNLSEKLKVSKEIRHHQRLSDYNFWFKHQILATSHYYIYETKPGLLEFSKVLFWISKRIHLSLYSVIISLSYSYLKMRLMNRNNR